MTSNKNDQQGSVFFYLLIGIALFAALAFNIARGFRAQSTNSLTDKTALLSASDVMHYAQTIEQAVDRVRRKGCSESDISFDHSAWGHTDYQHTPVAPDECKIFDPAGGGVSFEDISAFHDKNTDSMEKFIFSGAGEVDEIGTTCGAAQCTELYLFVRMYRAQTICREINNALNITAELPSSTGLPNTKYNGSFSYGGTLSTAEFVGQNSGCYENTTLNHTDGTPFYDFYYVLLAR